MKKVFCLLALSSLVLTSCSSSDSASSTTNESDVLVSKMIETSIQDGTLTTTYTYNGKKMVKSVDSDGYYDLYTYTGDLLTKIESYDSDDFLGERNTFSYNSSGQLATYVRADFEAIESVREEFVYNSDGTVSTTTFYGDNNTSVQDIPLNTRTVHFSGGEVSMIEVMGNGNLVSTNTYTYDTKNYPFKNVTGFDKVSLLEGETVGIHHNILTYTKAESSVTHLYNTNYTYNSSNFPLTSSKAESTNPTLTTTTQYFYN